MSGRDFEEARAILDQAVVGASAPATIGVYFHIAGAELAPTLGVRGESRAEAGLWAMSPVRVW